MDSVSAFDSFQRMLYRSHALSQLKRFFCYALHDFFVTYLQLLLFSVSLSTKVRCKAAPHELPTLCAFNAHVCQLYFLSFEWEIKTTV